MLYFKREWKDTRGDKYDNWGTCTYYFETQDDGQPTRHIEVYKNGNVLKYSNLGHCIYKHFVFLNQKL